MKRAALAALVGLVLLMTGCSSFNRDWNAALDSPAPAGSPVGLWDGHWISKANGHKGRLRCMISEGAQAPEHTARYKATYARILRISYSVPMEITPDNGISRLSGNHDLGALAGGIYDYAGVISNGQFLATYTSRWDYGEFQLTRPGQRQDR